MKTVELTDEEVDEIGFLCGNRIWKIESEMSQVDDVVIREKSICKSILEKL